MKNTLIQVNNDGMGAKEEALSKTLILKYFQLLSEEETPPAFIVFYNRGVRLLCEGEETLIPLQKLTEKGTKLIACSTCLNYFNLIEKLSVGISGSMQDIINLQSKVDKVITL